MHFLKRKFLLWLILIIFLFPPAARAADGTESPATAFIAMVVLLLAAKVASLIERLGQPPVLGELLAGVALGNLAFVGIHWFDPIPTDVRINFLAQLGVVILLFQVGLETNVDDMRRVGGRAFAVACVGVALPFFFTTVLVAPLLLPGLSGNAYVFLGATLTATSIGITARVFRDLGRLKSREAQIVLGAAVIDDVMGLIILAVVVGVVSVGSVDFATVGLILFKSVTFLIAAVILGRLLAPSISRFFSRIHTGIGMKFTIAICFGLGFAYAADQIGLAPIIGAFAAGLVLDPVHFRFFENPKIINEIRAAIRDAEPATRERVTAVIEEHADRHVDDLMIPVANFLVPLFFVLTGMGVRLDVLLNPQILIGAIGITLAALVGKLMTGLVAGKVNKWIVGWGMAPRGEVELIFAATGKAIGVISDDVFSMVIVVIILSTLLTPPILTYVVKHSQPSPSFGAISAQE